MGQVAPMQALCLTTRTCEVQAVAVTEVADGKYWRLAAGTTAAGWSQEALEECSISHSER